MHDNDIKLIELAVLNKLIAERTLETSYKECIERKQPLPNSRYIADDILKWLVERQEECKKITK